VRASVSAWLQQVADTSYKPELHGGIFIVEAAAQA
jgi:hypothetical protein